MATRRKPIKINVVPDGLDVGAAGDLYGYCPL